MPRGIDISNPSVYNRHYKLGNYVNVFLIHKELHQCKNCNSKNYISNEAEDVMGNFK